MYWSYHPISIITYYVNAMVVSSALSAGRTDARASLYVCDPIASAHLNSNSRVDQTRELYRRAGLAVGLRKTGSHKFSETGDIPLYIPISPTQADLDSNFFE